MYFDRESSSGGKIQNSQEALAFVSVKNFENKASIKHVNDNNRSSWVKESSPNSYHFLIDNLYLNTRFNLICRHYNLFN